MIIEEPLGKRPLDRSRLRWEERFKKEVETVESNKLQKELKMDKERWGQICLGG